MQTPMIRSEQSKFRCREGQNATKAVAQALANHGRETLREAALECVRRGGTEKNVSLHGNAQRSRLQRPSSITNLIKVVDVYVAGSNQACDQRPTGSQSDLASVVTAIAANLGTFRRAAW